MTHRVFTGTLTIEECREIVRYAGFDESKVKRDEEGKFSTTGGAAKKSAHEMTGAELKEAVGELNPTNEFVETTTQDWGNLRGQGKRRGGMVMGGMRDSSLQGKKTYTDPIGKLDEEQRADVRALSDDGNRPSAMLDYLRGRSFGLSHDDAIDLAYELAGDLEDGEAHKRISARAKGEKPFASEPATAEPEKKPSKVMNAEEFRDAISAVRMALNSLKSAVGEKESRREAEWVQRAADELRSASSPRASARDRELAANLLREADAEKGRYSVAQCQAIADLVRYQFTEHQHPRARDGTFMERGGGRDRSGGGEGGAGASSGNGAASKPQDGFPDDSAKPIDPKGGDKPEVITPTKPTTLDLPAAKKTQVEPNPAQKALGPAQSSPTAPAPDASGTAHTAILKAMGVSEDPAKATAELEGRSAAAEAKAKKYAGLHKRAAGLFAKTGDDKYRRQMEMYKNSAAREGKKPGLIQQLIAVVTGKAPANPKTVAGLAPLAQPDPPDPEPEEASPFAGLHEESMADRWKRFREGQPYSHQLFSGESPERYSVEQCRAFFGTRAR